MIVIVIAIEIVIHVQGQEVDHVTKGDQEMIENNDEIAEIEIIIAVATVIVIGIHGRGLEVDHGTKGGQKTIEISDEIAGIKINIITARTITRMIVTKMTEVVVVGIVAETSRVVTKIDNQDDKISVVVHTVSIQPCISLIATTKTHLNLKSMNTFVKNLN